MMYHETCLRILAFNRASGRPSRNHNQEVRLLRAPVGSATAFLAPAAAVLPRREGRSEATQGGRPLPPPNVNIFVEEGMVEC